MVRDSRYEDTRKSTALETLRIFLRGILSKNYTGWEVMEIFTTGVQASDSVFMVSWFERVNNPKLITSPFRASRAVSTQSWEIYLLLVHFICPNGREEALIPTTTLGELRHHALQLAIMFMAGIQQLSPGAYFLRQNMFPSICSVCQRTFWRLLQ